MAVRDGAFGLRGVSAVMAAICGLAGLVLSLFLVAMAWGSIHTAVTNKQVAWSGSSAAGSAHANFTAGVSRTCSGKPMVCSHEPKPMPARIAAPFVAGQLAAMVPMVALTYGLFQACLCFVGMARGRFLHRRTVSRLMRFAGGGLVFVLANPFSGVIGRWAAGAVDGLLRFVLHERSWSVFTGAGMNVTGVHGLLMVVYAVTLTVIAVVMAKASAIADDHAQIV